MPADYDLVIVGKSAAATWAAWQGTQEYARIALVTQGSVTQGSITQKSMAQGSSSCPSLQDSRATFLQDQTAQSVAENLSHAGVDYIDGQGSFQVEGHNSPIFEVNQRLLRSRRYLLSLEAIPTALNIAGLGASDVYDLPRFTREIEGRQHPQVLPQTSLSQHVVLVGNGPLTLELSQRLRRQKFEVSIVSSPQLLPLEDRDAVFFLQCQLEAEGIQCYSQNTTPTGQVNSQGKLELNTPQGLLTGDWIVTPDQSRVPLDLLNLNALNIASDQGYIAVNTSLQTDHPLVYACGDSLGGYCLGQLAQAEMAIALHNTLYSAQKTIDYHHLPYLLPGPTPLGRIGYTETQAQQRFPDVVGFEITLPPAELNDGMSPSFCRSSLDSPLFSSSSFGSPLFGSSPLFCKGVAQSDGRLIGVHLVGAMAPLALEVFAIAVQSQMSVVELPRLRPAQGFLLPLFERLANRWQRSREKDYRDRQEKTFRKYRKGHSFSR